MHKIIRKNLTGRNQLLFFISTNVIYMIMILITIPKVMNYAGGMKIFDMMPSGYTYQYANTLLNALGQTGRDAYLYKQLPFDMVYPFLFALTYSLMTVYFLKKLGKTTRIITLIWIFPVIAGAFDYLENTCSIIMLTGFPDVTERLVSTASVISVTKSVFSTISLTLLMILIVLYAIKRFLLKKID